MPQLALAPMQPRPDIQVDRREERNFSKRRDHAQQVLHKHKERAKDINRRKSAGEQGRPSDRDNGASVRPTVLPRSA